MPVPRRRHSKQKRDSARAHKGLEGKQIAKCDHCGEPKLTHRICPKCGHYKGRPYRATVTS